MVDDPQLLDAMLEDLAQQRDVHRPGPYWQAYARRIAAAIRSEGLDRFRSSPAIGRGFVDVFAGDSLSRRDPGWGRSALKALVAVPGVAALYRSREARAALKERKRHAAKQAGYAERLDVWFRGFAERHELPDTTIADPQRRLVLGGREIGELYLRTFAWIDELSGTVDLRQVRTVVEIGGGFGAMAHSLMTLFPNIRKFVYVDIPPVLYVGTQYLKNPFGDAVIDYRATRGLTEIAFSADDRREIMAIAPWQLPCVRETCDVFWNSSSFQEMPGAVVAHYAGQADRLLAKDGALAFYIYDGGAVTRLLDAESIIAAIAGSTRFRPAEVPAPLSDAVLPGRLFVAR